MLVPVPADECGWVHQPFLELRETIEVIPRGGEDRYRNVTFFSFEGGQISDLRMQIAQMNHQAAIDFIQKRLKEELAEHLFYHSYGHTVDVIEASVRIGAAEGVTDDELNLLSVAAAYHDCGFLTTYAGHEEAGCSIARETLPRFGFGERDIETICTMIMATQVPQQPQSLLAEILCDADLDYLGREDFYSIGQQLFKEWMVVGIVTDERTWNQIQVKFLNVHQYHTAHAKKLRNPVKQTHLAALEQLVAGYDD